MASSPASCALLARLAVGGDLQALYQYLDAARARLEALAHGSNEATGTTKARKPPGVKVGPDGVILFRRKSIGTVHIVAPSGFEVRVNGNKPVRLSCMFTALDFAVRMVEAEHGR